MAFPKIFSKLFKNAGAGPDLNEEIVTNVVRKTGNEEVDGRKTFIYDSSIDGTTSQATEIFISNPTIKKNTSTSDGKQHYSQIIFTDDTNDGTDTGRVGALLYHHPSSDGTGAFKQPYLKLAMLTNTENKAEIGISYDYTNNVSYAHAPSTSINRTYGEDIITRDWTKLNGSDTGLVHTSMDEYIGGVKRFTGEIHTNSWIWEYFTRNLGEIKTSNEFRDFVFSTADDQRLMGIEACMRSDGATDIKFLVNENKTSGTASGYGWLTLVLYMDASNSNRVLYSSKSTKVNNVIKYTDLGSSSDRFGQIYTTSNVNVSSDRRIKDFIDKIPDNVLDVWEDINWVQFKFKNSINEKTQEKARLHTGLVAQDLLEIFTSQNVDISKYGLFCHDEWDTKEEERDENGNIIQPAVESGDEYSIRYEEALCMEAAYQRRRASRAEERITALEQKVAELERKTA